MLNLWTISVSVTRKWFYVLTIFFSVFFVLLPISITAYSYFYSFIIPKHVIHVPLHFNPTDYGSISWPIEFDYSLLDPNTHYDAQFDVAVICDNSKSGDAFNVNYDIDKLGIMDSAPLVCDPRVTHSISNYLVPFKLRLWAPPMLVDWDIRGHVKFTIGPLNITQLKNFQKAVTTFDGFYIVDNSRSRLDLLVRWEGFRFYIVHYFKTSLVVGVGFFWIISSTMFFLTTIYVWYSDGDDVSTNKQDLGVKKEE